MGCQKKNIKVCVQRDFGIWRLAISLDYCNSKLYSDSSSWYDSGPRVSISGGKLALACYAPSTQKMHLVPWWPEGDPRWPEMAGQLFTQSSLGLSTFWRITLHTDVTMTDMRCRHIIVEDGVMNFILQKTGFSLVKSRLALGSRVCLVVWLVVTMLKMAVDCPLVT